MMVKHGLCMVTRIITTVEALCFSITFVREHPFTTVASCSGMHREQPPIITTMSG